MESTVFGNFYTDLFIWSLNTNYRYVSTTRNSDLINIRSTVSDFVQPFIGPPGEIKGKLLTPASVRMLRILLVMYSVLLARVTATYSRFHSSASAFLIPINREVVYSTYLFILHSMLENERLAMKGITDALFYFHQDLKLHIHLDSTDVLKVNPKAKQKEP